MVSHYLFSLDLRRVLTYYGEWGGWGVRSFQNYARSFYGVYAQVFSESQLL